MYEMLGDVVVDRERQLEVRHFIRKLLGYFLIVVNLVHVGSQCLFGGHESVLVRFAYLLEGGRSA